MPRTVDHELRRAQLTEVTAREIARVGLDGVRLRDVAKAAGWTTGAVSHYFTDKRELLLATFRSRTEMAEAAFRQLLASGASELAARLDTLLPLNAEQTLNWKVWLAFWGAAVGDESLTAEQRHRYEMFRGGLERAVQAEQRAGSLDADLEPPDEARLLATLVDGIAVQAVFAPDLWPASEQRRLLAEHLASRRTAAAARS